MSGRRQTISWNKSEIKAICLVEKSEIWLNKCDVLLRKMHRKTWLSKCRTFCLNFKWFRSKTKGISFAAGKWNMLNSDVFLWSIDVQTRFIPEIASLRNASWLNNYIIGNFVSLNICRLIRRAPYLIYWTTQTKTTIISWVCCLAWYTQNQDGNFDSVNLWLLMNCFCQLSRHGNIRDSTSVR